ncbi:MAG: hypothetical protein HOV94_29890 [Saccharothrix sp.]|nr:hypothetical protein [Saccharothrix sp.]
MPTAPNAVIRATGIIADLLRVAVLGAAVFTAVSDQVEGSIRLGLVLLILLASRLASLPRPLDLAVCVLLPVATAASLFHWYRQITWLDWVLHCVCTGALAAMVYLLLLRARLLPALRDQSRGAVVLLTALVGIALGVVWEFYEWFAEIVAGVRIGVGYTDTIADLAMDTLGSVLTGVALVAWSADRREPHPRG